MKTLGVANTDHDKYPTAKPTLGYTNIAPLTL